MQFSLKFLIPIYLTPAATYKTDFEVNDLYFWFNFTQQKTKKSKNRQVIKRGDDILLYLVRFKGYKKNIINTYLCTKYATLII